MSENMTTLANGAQNAKQTRACSPCWTLDKFCRRHSPNPRRFEWALPEPLPERPTWPPLVWKSVLWRMRNPQLHHQQEPAEKRGWKETWWENKPSQLSGKWKLVLMHHLMIEMMPAKRPWLGTKQNLTSGAECVNVSSQTELSWCEERWPTNPQQRD